MVELKSSGVKNYWVIGDVAIALTAIRSTSSPDLEPGKLIRKERSGHILIRTMIAESPYSQLAPEYDDFVGRTQFCRARRVFDHCVRKHGLTFSSMADFGCGTGLLAQYVAYYWGVPVYAVDRSAPMLRVAVRRCRCRCRPVLCDYRELSLPRPVDLITMFSFTLNLAMSDQGLTRTLNSVWRNLCAGGSWIVDFLTPSQRACSIPATSKARTEAIFRTPRRLCLRLGVRSSHGNWHSEHHCARLLPPIELHDQLMHRGFQLIDAFDSATPEPPRESSNALVLLLRKPVSAGV